MGNVSLSFGEREKALAEYVGKQVTTLQEAYRRKDGNGLAAMAKLRRGVGRAAGADPALWEFTLAEFPEAITDQLSWDERDGVATVWERAAYDAITLHAVHQQSRTGRMHQKGRSVGAAAALLGRQADAENAVRARFHALGTALDHDARLVHLRGLISQLRNHEISLDYARLAVDLRRLDDGTYADRVLLAWGRDYHRSPKADPTSDDDTPATGDQQ
ncbi:type I-E CRISPR-associated protein Cse2/CasB [Nocardia farcinica]|uniref:CRISPR-associated Cse2 family protein n=1 Tax=Nocardia farcinica TaxID=37329 RepID=A0A0H5P6X1_NOCFR|nr:type I-E CRISPR-associated protein Cse2/CasB [Nocardia farcinica]AXK88202.1 type I-E CRISPR-associated protein Cse2/CasB [Nocardia farcinica]MBA4854763.1 type I-E CRISPR-associated protein Cse2/CasB [Nocardia farcinica]MBC9815074.1 type I-E CRISPR-associated protein Cse2/CasB [Nocardia farcinica]MBF6071759.1 type I-E CRISPR-associated protein Cse2/CasB [Nocardia farcinica]MBF6261526.1 type I-E CRISPR-associated protein Cse2/CasB [Nocardia farcinica]